jgi:hypothetical protein
MAAYLSEYFYGRITCLAVSCAPQEPGLGPWADACSAQDSMRGSVSLELIITIHSVTGHGSAWDRFVLVQVEGSPVSPQV